MKRCSNCDSFFDNNLDYCPNCNEKLTPYTPKSSLKGSSRLRESSRNNENGGFLRESSCNKENGVSLRESSHNNENGVSKKRLGFLFCLIYNILGLLGVLMYLGDDKSFERESFVKGWLSCFVLSMVLLIIFLVIVIYRYLVS